MAFHFTSETPDDQYFVDFGNLNKLELEVSCNARCIFQLFNACTTPPYQQLAQLNSLVINFLAAPDQVISFGE